jgi:hypothetical protein
MVGRWPAKGAPLDFRAPDTIMPPGRCEGQSVPVLLLIEIRLPGK